MVLRPGDKVRFKSCFNGYPEATVMDWEHLDPKPIVPFDEYVVRGLKVGDFLVLMLSYAYNDFLQYAPYYVAHVAHLELK